MTAWQASPDAPGMWWRDGGDGPVAWEVRVGVYGRLYATEAVGEMPASIFDLSPRDGVRWARCVPPVEALVPDPPPRCTVTHHTGCACHEARRDAEVTALRARVEALTAERAERQRHTDAAVDGVRAMLPAALAAARRESAEAMRSAAVAAVSDAVEAAGLDADLSLDAHIAVTHAVVEAVRALPLPGIATPEHATTPGPVCPAPTGAP